MGLCNPSSLFGSESPEREGVAFIDLCQGPSEDALTSLERSGYLLWSLGQADCLILSSSGHLWPAGVDDRL